MLINFTLYQPYLAILLPVLMPYLADGLASILSQDGFDPLTNDILAWVFLLIASVGSGFIDNQLLGTPSVIINALVSIATLLIAGPLTSLKPWINFSAFLQSNVFVVVKQGATNLTAQLVVGEPVHVENVITPQMLEQLAVTVINGLHERLARSLQPIPRVMPQVIPPRPIVQPPIQMPVQQPNIAVQNTGVMPVPVQPVPEMPQRNWNNSGLIPVVQQPGQ